MAELSIIFPKFISVISNPFENIQNISIFNSRKLPDVKSYPRRELDEVDPSLALKYEALGESLRKANST